MVNTPEFSPGMLSYAFYEPNGSRDYSSVDIDYRAENKTHPDRDVRCLYAAKYLNTISNGKVHIDPYYDEKFKYNGKYFMKSGYISALENNESNKLERTVYLAGQIASCIYKGVWNVNNLKTIRENEWFDTGSRTRTLLVAIE